MSVTFEKLFDWAILPSKVVVDASTKNHCFSLKNPQKIRLYPDTINHICLGFRMKIPYGYTFQIKKLFKEPVWQILSDYLIAPYLDNLPVSIPIVSSSETLLYPGDILAHLQLYPVCFISPILSGKNQY
ncbi:MAG: hypothetical protein EHM77_00140 [Planctomycetaceae bacterium]|jgi:hypothetical protein|nr:MAG: hypothetical protein EHM77_06400 [Planctomycetaceae bacterium]RPH84472.1 MAG: hypothetical protein EHM77_00140 [Planctomycetaceae bacterium]